MSLKSDLNKYTPRQEQQDCLDFIIKTKTDKPDTKFFLLNLPMGVGKSHMSMMISDWYSTKIDKVSKIDIITAGKILQDQYDDTYESINNLKGKENYECVQYACSCANGKEFNRLNKTSCEFCPYDEARGGYINGKVSLTNFYLYLIYALYNNGVSEQRDSKVLIVDECLHPDTEITLSDGGLKKIKDIEIGDLVKTINEISGDIEIKPVVKLHRNLNKGTQMYEIEGERGDMLKITGNHKVKLLNGDWKKVEDLNELDQILSITESKIKSIKKIDYKEDVYNLHIKDNHNYFANNHCVSNCHEFDDVMSNFISIKITESTVKKLKFTNEDDILKNLKRVSTITQYITFLEYLRGEVVTTIDDVDKSMQGDRSFEQDKRDLRISKIIGVGGNNDVKLMQVIGDLKQYLLKIDLFLKEYGDNPHNWVLETYFNEKTDQKELSLEPIWAYDYLDKYVWSRYDMVIMMSGTILNKGLFCELNGLDDDKTVYYSVPSPFPIKNRPIYYMPLGKMSYTKKEETFNNYVAYLHKLLKKYQGKKGIIHTNSFELANWIQRAVENPRLVFHDSTNKDEMLRRHFETDEPTVFVSPSVGTGVSFDHDKSRFQIISKVPYPSLGSQKNKMRQKNNPEWYSWKTCCTLQQMCGRSIRSKTDYADTIIIDSSFGDVLRYSSHLFPDWFSESIKILNVDKK